jgi:hypothetical protein
MISFLLMGVVIVGGYVLIGLAPTSAEGQAFAQGVFMTLTIISWPRVDAYLERRRRDRLTRFR